MSFDISYYQPAIFTASSKQISLQYKQTATEEDSFPHQIFLFKLIKTLEDFSPRGFCPPPFFESFCGKFSVKHVRQIICGTTF